MRLWHQDLLSELCQQHILGQHRECCALRGDGWGKDHSTVQYALDAAKSKLVAYHWLLMEHGVERFGISFDRKWSEINDAKPRAVTHAYAKAKMGQMIYPEHDRQFLRSDIEDLQARSEDPDHGCDCDVSFDLLEEAV